MTDAMAGDPVAGDDPATVTRRCVLAHVALGAAIAVVVVLIGLIVGLGVWAVLIGVVLGGIVAATLYVRGDAMALAALGARPLEPGEQPRLENLVEGLAVSNGFRMPAMHIVDDAALNAFAVGRSPDRAVLVVTSGMIERLRRIELEGVLAHELSRIRSGETHAAVTAATLIGRPLGFAGGLASSLAGRLVEPTAGVRADIAGAAMTRYPPGLAAALAAIRADGRTPVRNPRAYRHLWIDVPADPIVVQQFGIDERIDVLQEL